MNYRSIKKLTGVRLNVKQLFNRPLSVSIVMGLIVYLSYEGFTFMTGILTKSSFLQNLAGGSLAIAAGGIIYYLLMIVAKGLTADDIRSFPQGGKLLAITMKIPMLEKYLIK